MGYFWVSILANTRTIPDNFTLSSNPLHGHLAWSRHAVVFDVGDALVG